MDILLWILVFIVSIFLLLKASDWFIEAAETIGSALNIPSYIIGVTVVAFGTSLPELATSIASIYLGTSEIVVGNVVGSNITNILLVLGIICVISKKTEIPVDLFKADMTLLFGSAFLLYFILADQYVSLPESIVLIIGMIAFLAYTFTSGGDEEEEETEKIDYLTWLKLIGGGILVFLSAKYTVDAIAFLSAAAGVKPELIAITVVALGTSLPEVAVSVTAVRKGNAGLALGNILGSNIFNTFAVMGIPSLLGTLAIPDMIPAFSIPMMLVATLLFGVVTISREMNRWEGVTLLLFYFYFILESCRYGM